MYVSVWYYYCFVAEEREIVVLRERVGVVCVPVPIWFINMIAFMEKIWIKYT